VDFLELAAKPLFLVARFLLWLTWELMFQTIAWVIGWPIVRILSFGKLPRARIGGYEESGAGEAIFVCGAGFAVLVAAVWLLSMRYGWSW
jgi:hypothetical protein